MVSLEEKLDYILNFLDKLEFENLGRNNNKYFFGKLLTFFIDNKYHLSEIKIVLVATKYLPENLELVFYRNKLVDFYNKIKKEK
jgi:TnpA family transposase